MEKIIVTIKDTETDKIEDVFYVETNDERLFSYLVGQANKNLKIVNKIARCKKIE